MGDAADQHRFGCVAQVILQRVEGTVPSWQGGRSCNGKDAHDLTMLDPAAARSISPNSGLEGRWLGYSTEADWRDRTKPSCRAGN